VKSHAILKRISEKLDDRVKELEKTMPGQAIAVQAVSTVFLSVAIELMDELINEKDDESN